MARLLEMMQTNDIFENRLLVNEAMSSRNILLNNLISEFRISLDEHSRKAS